MVKGKSLLIGAGISVAIVILLICGMGAFDVKALSKTPDQTPPYMFRPDIITFDTMKVFGKLEKPTAVFLPKTDVCLPNSCGLKISVEKN